MTTMLGLACIAGDLIVLAALADLATSTLDQPGILAAAAGAASLARLACSIAALHLCRRARSAFVGRAQEFSQLTAASPIAASTASPCSRASNARSRYFPEIVVAVAELDVEVVLDGVISGRSRRV